MDTQKLIEWAENAGVNLRHDDIVSDCIAPWTEYLLSTPAEMADVWADFLAEMDPAGTEFKRVIEQFTFARQTANRAGSRAKRRFDDFSQQLPFDSAGIAFHIAFGASELFTHLNKEAEAYVTSGADEWLEECREYLAEREEGMKNDDAYQAHKDKLLDGDV